MPPRIRIRLEPGTADDRSVAVHDDDFHGRLALEHGKGLGLRFAGNHIARGDFLQFGEVLLQAGIEQIRGSLVIAMRSAFGFWNNVVDATQFAPN